MARERVFATCDIGGSALSELEAAGYSLETWPEVTPPSKEALAQRVDSGISALITTLKDPIDRELLRKGQGTLRIVAQDAVGLDNVDVASATEFGIAIAHTPDVLTDAVAEFAIFLLGAVARRIPASERLVREGNWSGWHPYEPFLGTEVGGKTLSVLGMGRIGRGVAARAVGLDMNLLLRGSGREDSVFSDSLQKLMDQRAAFGLARAPRTVRWCSFEDAIEGGDFISLHVPLRNASPTQASTVHLLDDQAFRRMKKGVFLINTARGSVIDEPALLEALRNGTVAGAALDVFETEPLPSNSPFLAPDLKDRVLVCHHFGSGTEETRLSTDPEVGMAGRVVTAVKRVLSGDDPSAISWITNGKALREGGLFKA